jgi:hypothetical protein|nr:MAG TPA: hypothetical protein [Caudoviricetes sp.]
MEEEIKEVKLPESLTLNGVTYSVKDTPELVAFMQAVAKVEKNKVHSTIDRLKAGIAELSKVELPKEESISAKSIIEELKEAFVTKADMESVVASSVQKVVQPLLEESKKSAEAELNAYREKLIAENSATCIPDLVKGSTKEELDASLKESIRLRSAYPTPSTIGQQGVHVTDPLLEQQAKQQNAPTNAPAPAQPKAPQMPTMGGYPSPAPTDVTTEIGKMSHEEFAKRREELIRQVQQLS